MRLPLCLALLTALLANTATAAAPAPVPAPAALAPLLSTIQERLAIADKVALSKWDSGKPVEDRQRERDVIAEAIAEAPYYKLSNETVEQFFSAQIEANKLVQYAHLSDWHAQGKAPNDPRPDLDGLIRPQLDLLQNRLLQQLADFTPYRKDPHCPLWLAKANKTAAQVPLRELALIRATAELCSAHP
ncbi:chorismate mutase [Pseudomonas frederiksbergensis]|uniref:Chorismate mutase n=1 Tax=Pseudomonas frederiksbergensis TaxID=104087 RepID=A0A1J0EKV5_9PSED|nr:chorismate mutase [Pseudomonas frederiksbergensis]APC16444.1 chorismate mutase [Pseudomonas frederiksbergensis]